MKRILVPTDFSELARRAVRHAGSIAQHAGAEVTVLYADTFMPPPHFTADQIPDLLRGIEQSKAAAKDLLNRCVAETLGSSAAWRTVVVEREPVEAILSTAEELDADLLVMGTHGRSGVDRLMLGSVTEKVLHRTKRPLMTTRLHREAPPEPRRVLVPTDLGAASRRSLALALRHAALFDSETVLLHVIGEGDDPPAAAWEQFLAAAGASTEIERRVARGPVAERVLQTAEEIGAALIVVGIEHKRFRDTTVLGSNVVKIIRHADVPVLAVP
ncbi:MAG TPA: universal stress protein [Thermoanaerobaculia bacterium]|nr:universal stress protein [Thermoanaerobaculia bacterium]